MLKVLYLPIGNQPGTIEAFEQAGVNLSVYDFVTDAKTRGNRDLSDTFLRRVSNFQPDLIHMQLQMTNLISPDTIVSARKMVPKAVITNWTGDIRSRPSPYFIEISKVIDYSLLSHVGQIHLYKRAGCRNPRYWQIGYDPARYFPQHKKIFKYKVSFAANSYRRNLFPDSRLRYNIAKRLKEEFGDAFGLFGSGYPHAWKARQVDIKAVNDIYNDSACVISVSHFNNVSHYFSDRLLMCLASGRPTIVYKFPGYQSYFADKSDILVAQSQEHLSELVRYCVANPKKVNEVGENGFRKVNSEHSFLSRIIELLVMTGLMSKV